MEDNKNLRIYEAGRQVPEEAQKQFNNGRFSGTDINPMWRIKKLTELFGPAGLGWYYEVLSERAEVVGDTTMAIVDLNLYIKDPDSGEWSRPIYGTGGNVLLSKGRASDEGYKMALTDALSVACKALGIGADIYFSKDKTKYTAEQKPAQDGGREATSSALRAPSPQGEGPAPGRQTKLGADRDVYRCKKCGAVVDEDTALYSREHCEGFVLCSEHQKAYFAWKMSQVNKGGNDNA